MSDIWNIIASLIGSGGLLTVLVIRIYDSIKAKRDKHTCDFSGITSRLDKMDARLDGIENRLSKAENKFDEFNNKVSVIEDKLDANTEGTKANLRAQLRMLGEQYIRDGEISVDDLDEWLKLHNIYHADLNGNGFLDSIRKKIEELPIKK